MAAHFTSGLAAALADDAVQRLMRYAQIDTQSRRDASSTPSTPGQSELARLLMAELDGLGVTDGSLDGRGYLMATLQASDGSTLQGTTLSDASFGLIAHVDTSPDAPGAGVTPILHRDYDGGVIRLPRAGTVLDPRQMPELAERIGHDIVTAGGDTLLGADDKAGVAAIMAAVAHLAAHPELPRPAVRIAFTPDEEIGMGGKRFDIERFGVRRAYTVDGSARGELQDESFSAVTAIVTFTGVDIHPGTAKGKMVNALRPAARFIAALPSDRLSPETTSGREGFIHPFELTGTSREAVVRLIVRDFDDDQLVAHLALLERTATDATAQIPGVTLHIETQRQYSNMRTFIERDPRVVAAAVEAMRQEGIEPIRGAIRGGTDGSVLSERGLPTPNIFDGGYEFHSVREWASVQDLAASAATLVRLAGVWARQVG